MFADSLLETSWAQRTRRSWTTLTSFGLQAVVIGLLLMIPLLKTVGLPLGTRSSDTGYRGERRRLLRLRIAQQHATTSCAKQSCRQRLDRASRTFPVGCRMLMSRDCRRRSSSDAGRSRWIAPGDGGSGIGIVESTNNSLRPIMPVRFR